MSEPATFDPDAARTWLDILYSQCTGHLHICATNDWAGRAFPPGQLNNAVDYITELDHAGREGIYARTTTLPGPMPGGRGRDADAHELVGLAADIDIAGPGHKTTKPLPPDEQAARAIIAGSGLPDPSVWVHSGGGLYPWWLLERPVTIRDAGIAVSLDPDRPATSLMDAQALSGGWQTIITAAAARHGYHYGPVGDLARVLRIPGTVNRKEALARPCRIIAGGSCVRYTVAELGAALDAALADIPAPADNPRGVQAIVRQSLAVTAGLTPFDDFEARTDWDDPLLLGGAGWTYAYQHGDTRYWRRPGKTTQGISATTGRDSGRDRLYVFTDATELETHTPLTKGHVYAVLHHHGNHANAARELRRLGYGDDTRAADHAAAIADILGPASTSPPPAGPGPTPAATELPGPIARPPSVLAFIGIRELCERVDAAGPRTWLLRGLWPTGDYGVHAAEMKAQKTWNTVDLAVSVASGTPWLGAVPVDHLGPVIMFAGEGGEADLVRRIRAVCAARELKAEDLPIEICTRAPHLSKPAHLADMADAINRYTPRLVTLDPLYLAANGANTAALTEMGALLEGAQHLCQGAGAALFIVTHHNRKDGRGAGRITGAGPAEWGRVLLSASVISRHNDPKTQQTTVITEIDALGGSIPSRTLRVTRRIHADDPDDLDSVLHYAVDTDDVAAGDDTPDDGPAMPPARRKLLDAVRGSTGPQTARQVVDRVVQQHGHGLRRETASRELHALAKAGLVDALINPGKETLWTPTEV